MGIVTQHCGFPTSVEDSLHLGKTQCIYIYIKMIQYVCVIIDTVILCVYTEIKKIYIYYKIFTVDTYIFLSNYPTY